MSEVEHITIANTTTSTLQYNVGDMAYLQNSESFFTLMNTDIRFPCPSIPDKSEYYTRKYNRYHMVCWVITIDPLSFLPRTEENGFKFVDVLLNLLIHQEHLRLSNNIIGVCQYAAHTGYHVHLCYLSKFVLSKEVIDEITAKLNISFTLNESEKYELVSSYQKINSTSSYLNYLKSTNKGTFYNFASNSEMAFLLCAFDKNVVFAADSSAKKQKLLEDGTHIISNNPLVLFFMKKLNDGAQTYDEVLMDANIQSYLHIQNLKGIWENCLSQFKANLTHTKNCQRILKFVLEQKGDKQCACAMIDLLIYQNIQPHVFGEALIRWLFGTTLTQKKNALLLEGPPDTGKSYLARLIWQLFYMHERIINDGLFSFAVAPGSGCLLWEETHISPELAEMTKLIMEGNETVTVAVKNKPSQRLNKRIPLLITNNKPMGVYCTNDQAAFDARCFKFNFKHPVSYIQICRNNVHYCPYIDQQYNAIEELQSDNPSSTADNEDKEDSVRNCLKFHKLTRESLIAFIGYSVRKFGYLIRANNPELGDLITDVQNNSGLRICTSTLLNYD